LIYYIFPMSSRYNLLPRVLWIQYPQCYLQSKTMEYNIIMTDRLGNILNIMIKSPKNDL
jgi:hypothetical protein